MAEASGTGEVAIEAYAKQYRVAAQGFARLLQAVESVRWDRPTPCEGWSVRTLVRHSAEVHGRVAALADVPVPALDDGDVAGSWRSASAAVDTALDDPDRRAMAVQSRSGTMPFAQMVGTLLATDTLIHTWDLARGAELPDALDPDAAAAALAFMERNEAVIRVPGGFGPAVTPPPGADVQARLLCFAGRSPA